MNRMEEKKKLIQHNITYKKFKIKIFLKKKKRKRTWLTAIRNFDMYIYIYILLKCHQRRNYQINGDIYSSLG